MNFEQLVEIVGDEPLFETGFLLVGEVKPADIQRQLSRWTKADRLYQLHRGLYALAPPYQKMIPHPFLIANRLVRGGTYVSLQSALAYYNLIPENVPVVTSVTVSRPTRWNTPLGSYEFRHIKTDLLWGYRLLEVGPGQQAFVATPEKALLDLIYLEPGADSFAYLQELRLQHLDSLDLATLHQYTDRANSPKLHRTVKIIENLAQVENLDYETL